MRLRLVPTIMPGVLVLALVAHGNAASRSDHPIPIPYGHTRASRIIDDHAETLGHTVISALAQGQVTSVEVHNNEHVPRGQILFRIDDRPYRLAVAAAQAELVMKQHRIAELRAAYRQHLAGLAAAQDVLPYQERAHEIQTRLLSSGMISQLEFDRATTALLDARERVLAEQSAIAETLADLDTDPDLPIDQHPAVERAKAELDRAELDLSHTQVTAPEDGIVTNVDRLRVGEYVQVGAAVFDLVSEKIASRS
jgi:membrane fusion protein, multidrug efflux system